jgi:hypothetical protein
MRNKDDACGGPSLNNLADEKISKKHEWRKEAHQLYQGMG